MNLTNNFNNSLDDIKYDKAIFTKNHIYRKISNLLNTYDVYVLTTLDDNFVWEKTESYNDIFIHHTSVDFGELRCVTENKPYLTIYKTYEDVATDLMIYNGSNNLVWDKLSINLDINNLVTISLLEIPNHINLVKDNDIFTTLEPLHGWDNLCERIPPDNNDKDNNDKDNYPDMNDGESIHSRDLVVEFPYVEYRIDPYDGEWYSKDEFNEYYGALSIWDHQDPKKVLKREEFCHFTNTFGYLDEKKFIFLFKQYEKTFQ
jgi:hypothetical protein